MWKQIFGILTIALLATGCGSSGGRELSAAEPPADAAAQASQLQPATEQPKMGRARVRRYLVRPREPRRPNRLTRETDRARVEPADAAFGTDWGGALLTEFTLPVGTTLPVELKSTVASDVSEVEDTVRATLRNAVTVDGQEVLPGTELAGHVTEAERRGA